MLVSPETSGNFNKPTRGVSVAVLRQKPGGTLAYDFGTCAVVLCLSGQRQTHIAIMAYAAESRDWMPIAGTQGVNHLSNPHWGDLFYYLGNWDNLGRLYDKGYISQANFLYCPSQESKYYKFETYKQPTYPTPQNIGWGTFINISFSYNLLVANPQGTPGNNPSPDMLRKYPKFSDMPSNQPLLCDTFNEGVESYWHPWVWAHPNPMGLNTICADGSGRFVQDDTLADIVILGGGLTTWRPNIVADVYERLER